MNPDDITLELTFNYSKSSGPGGQKINKTNSKATVLWNYKNSRLLTPSQKSRFKYKYKQYISKEDVFSISSQTQRSAKQNTQECVNKILFFIKQILKPPIKRLKTKPSKSSKIKRLNSKKLKGLIKKGRKKVKF